MTISQSHEELQSAIVLQINAELFSVSLRECNVSTGSLDTDGPFHLNVSYLSAASPMQEQALRITVSFKIQGLENKEFGAEIFSIDCSFLLEYMITDPEFEPTEESIMAFKDGNAVFNCWPYTREFVQNLTARMAINTAPLPFLRISPKPITLPSPGRTDDSVE